MRFFRKARKNDGWLSIAFVADGIVAAHIRRLPEAKPSVVLANFYPYDEPMSAAALEKVGRELRSNDFNCSTLLGGREYQMLSLDAPNVPADELKVAVRWRLKDMLDFAVDDATIDVLDIPVDQNGTVRNHSMFAIAARNSVIEQRQTLFAEANVKISVVDIPEMSQRNIASLLEPDGRGLAMLSFGSDGGLLTVTYGGELYLARRIDIGLEQLHEPDHDRKHAHFDRITLELQRSLDHFDRQFNFINISKLILGPTAVSGLEEYLTSNLYTPVETMDLAQVLDLELVPALGDVAQQQRFFAVLGAALRLEELAS